MSPLTARSKATLSPGLTPSARRVSAGMVIWPLLVILASWLLAGGGSGRIFAVAGIVTPYLMQYMPYFSWKGKSLFTCVDRRARRPWRRRPLRRGFQTPAGRREGIDLARSSLLPPRIRCPAFGLVYSYFSDSTGSICAARVAGTVPKTTPTTSEISSAATIDHGEMGIA